MPNAVENAFALLLGQITIIASSIFFGVPYFLVNASAGAPPIPDHTIFFLAAIFSACAMMIGNIIIGWTATRTMLREFPQYSVRMFVADVMIILCFFAMNNVIMFSFGDALSMQNTATIQKIMAHGISSGTSAITFASLYFLTAIFLSICKRWNYEYYRLMKKDDYRPYETQLTTVIVVLFAISILTIIMPNFLLLQIVCFVVWFGLWLFVNASWVSSNIIPSDPITDKK